MSGYFFTRGARAVQRVPIVVAAGGFDPTAQTLNGYWRASYGGAPWTGTASAGSSGSYNLIEGTAPAVGGSVNGFTSADYNGTDSRLDGSTVVNHMSASAYTIGALVRVNSLPTTTNAPGSNVFNNEAIAGDGAGYVGMYLRDASSVAKAQAYHFDSAEQGAEVTITVSAWTFVHIRFGSGTLEIGTNGTWSGSDTGSNLGSTAGTFITGRGFSANFSDFDLLELFTMNAAISDADTTSWKSYFNTRYALSL